MNKAKNLREIRFTNHFIKQARHKGFTAEQIQSAIESPYKITKVSKHEGQLRYCGDGVAVVMDGNSAITIYADGVITPMREDRKDDPDARTSVRLSRLS